MNSIKDFFPKPPSYSGMWSAIYLEPIVDSGEKFTIAIIAISQTESMVFRVINEKLLEHMYGSSWKRVDNLISWVIESAKHKIARDGNIDNWTGPFQGVSLSEPRFTRSVNINGIIKQALSISSGLYREETIHEPQ